MLIFIIFQLLDNIPIEQVEQYLKNRPSYTVHYNAKKHQNVVRLLQKTINKKLNDLKNTENDHILIVSSTLGSSPTHLLHRPTPNFTGNYLFYPFIYFSHIKFMYFVHFIIYFYVLYVFVITISGIMISIFLFFINYYITFSTAKLSVKNPCNY